MFAPSFSSSPAFPPADALLKALGSVNYKLLAIKLILIVISVAAFTVAVCSFAYKNAKAFWAAHGETILFHAALFVERLVKTSKVAFNAAVSFKPVALRAINRAADWLFYQMAA
jgi:hypothetical protein